MCGIKVGQTITILIVVPDLRHGTRKVSGRAGAQHSRRGFQGGCSR
jgi:hypothetical protein